MNVIAHVQKWQLALGFAATLALLLSAAPAQAQTGQLCFPETGYCIEGRIREYWQQNGGLPVFGFPITPQREERIEGNALQVQWFERNRLELHPENARPYDVLLGRLGADRLAQLGRDWFTFPTADPATANGSCQYFQDSGHSVCNEFLQAFRKYGLEFGHAGNSFEESLALFGLPLSEPMLETLSDGKQYQVQWFERARFELHPENQPPYNVLFGLLGNEFRGLSGGVTPNTSVVRGTVAYRQRSALPPSAVIQVQLVDVSRADAPAIVLAETSFAAGGKQVPFSFELPYNPADINPSHTYAVQARITVDGQLRFINTTRYSVITNGNPSTIEIIVDPV